MIHLIKDSLPNNNTQPTPNFNKINPKIVEGGLKAHTIKNKGKKVKLTKKNMKVLKNKIKINEETKK